MTPHATLREATRAVHERLHHLSVFADLASGTITLPDYRALLKRLLGFHSPLEAALVVALDPNPFGLDPHGWKRAHLLRQDLSQLTRGPGGSSPLESIEVASDMSQAQAMGCLYVIEGSTLGGRQLARQLDPTWPTNFLRGGAQPGHPRWASVCAALDACGADDRRLSEMVASASKTFGQFASWFVVDRTVT